MIPYGDSGYSVAALPDKGGSGIFYKAIQNIVNKETIGVTICGKTDGVDTTATIKEGDVVTKDTIDALLEVLEFSNFRIIENYNHKIRKLKRAASQVISDLYEIMIKEVELPERSELFKSLIVEGIILDHFMYVLEYSPIWLNCMQLGVTKVEHVSLDAAMTKALSEVFKNPITISIDGVDHILKVKI